MAARFPCDESNGIPIGPVQATLFPNEARKTNEIQAFKAKLKIEQKQISHGYSRILRKVNQRDKASPKLLHLVREVSTKAYTSRKHTKIASRLTEFPGCM